MKNLFIILAILGGLYFSVWFFNHINAWGGFAVAITTISISYQLLKPKKKLEKNETNN